MAAFILEIGPGPEGFDEAMRFLHQATQQATANSAEWQLDLTEGYVGLVGDFGDGKPFLIVAELQPKVGGKEYDFNKGPYKFGRYYSQYEPGGSLGSEHCTRLMRTYTKEEFDWIRENGYPVTAILEQWEVPNGATGRNNVVPAA